jgi:hypothetical protein
MQVFGLWYAVDAYEGCDICLGIYSDYAKAREAEISYLSDNSSDEVYITKIGIDVNEFDNYGDAIGEVV